jgi:hypothetical protein
VTLSICRMKKIGLKDNPVSARPAAEAQRQLQPVAQAQLAEHRRHMRFDGALGDLQLAGDFLVAQPLGNELRGFAFSLAEQGQVRCGRPGTDGAGRLRNSRCTRSAPTHKPP